RCGNEPGSTDADRERERDRAGDEQRAVADVAEENRVDEVGPRLASRRQQVRAQHEDRNPQHARDDECRDRPRARAEADTHGQVADALAYLTTRRRDRYRSRRQHARVCTRTHHRSRGYLHPDASKMRTASAFNSPSTERFSVSARNSPHPASVGDGGTAGFAGYSWLPCAKNSWASGLERNSIRRTALSRFFACAVTPMPLTFT